jgi:hypothetical protein
MDDHRRLVASRSPRYGVFTAVVLAQWLVSGQPARVGDHVPPIVNGDWNDSLKVERASVTDLFRQSHRRV